MFISRANKSPCLYVVLYDCFKRYKSLLKKGLYILSKNKLEIIKNGLLVCLSTLSLFGFTDKRAAIIGCTSSSRRRLRRYIVAFDASEDVNEPKQPCQEKVCRVRVVY